MKRSGGLKKWFQRRAMKSGVEDRKCGDPPKKLFWFGLFWLVLRQNKQRWYLCGYDSKAAQEAAEKSAAERLDEERKREAKHAAH